MLYLSSKDIDKCIDYNELIEQIEKALVLYDSKEFIMPDRIHENYNDETYLYMPCFTKTIKGTKVLTLYPNNPKKNLAVIQGVMLLNNSETGKIKCLLDGAKLTSVRTGAVGGTGIKYTTREESKTLGVVGAGVQGLQQAIFSTKIRNLETVYVADLNKKACEKFVKNLSKEVDGVEVKIAEDTRELTEKSDIIITTTTATKPVLPDDEKLLEGKHYIGVGSYKPFMREFPESLYKVLDKIYIDVEFAKEESGDLATPIEKSWIKEEQVETISEGIRKNDINKSKTTFYKTVGMAMFDIIVGEYFYQKALKLGLGQEIKE